MESQLQLIVHKSSEQAWKFYVAPFVWTFYLVFLPKCMHYSCICGLIIIAFPGLWLFTWTGYLMHESWHKYIPTVPNTILYNILSIMLITDPQIYHMIHGSHHADVNSWNDVEFHPVGQIKSRYMRILYNTAEVVLGIAFLSIVSSIVIPVHPRYKYKFKRKKQILAIIGWILFYGTTGGAAYAMFDVTLSNILWSYLLLIYAGSVLLHISQIAEHGNLIVEGDIKTRNIKTRNVQPTGFGEKLFLFLTHHDSQEHVFHHTLVKYYLRPYPNSIPLPTETTKIGIDKGAILESYASPLF